MESNKNKRLDELFKKAKNEKPKVSFDQIKNNFLSSNHSVVKAVKGGKLTTLSIKGIIVIITTAITIVGFTLFFYDNSTTIDKGKKVENDIIKLSLTDSAIVAQEHEKVIAAYIEKVEAIRAKIPIEFTGMTHHLKMTMKEVDFNKFNTSIGERDSINKSIDEDTSYHFPILNKEELKAQRKQMMKMFGKMKKEKN